MNRPLGIGFSCLLAAAGLASTARADDACAADRTKLCSAAKGRQKAQCMKDHEAELSEACKAQRATVKQAAEEVHADCQADVDKLCQGVKPGRGRVHACLKSHSADLSAACKTAIANVKELKEQIHPGCRPDAEKLCQGITPGGGRIFACLQSHEAELAPACKAQIDKRLEKRKAREAAKAAPAK